MTNLNIDFERVPTAIDDEVIVEDEGQAALDFGDRATVRKVHRDAKAAETEFNEYIKTLMSTLQGRSFVRTVVYEWCHVATPSFVTEAAQTAFNEGERNVGQRLLASVIALAPQDYVKMLMETSNGR